ncbi:MAG: 16S rRNA (uracil(1498)-N(3))-methyltransferase [Desulfopila sp.]
MNLLLAESTEVVEGRLVVTDRRADHLVKVLHVARGDTVRVGIVDGPQGVGVVEAVTAAFPRSVSLCLTLHPCRAQRPAIDLIVALARPIMMRRIFSQAAALGVGALYCIQARRVEKSFWEATLFEQKGYGEHLRQGLEQAMDTRLPEVHFYRRFKPFVEDVLPAVAKGYDRCILAHPAGRRTLVQALAGTRGRVLVAVGPEGGWIDYEVERFHAAGLVSCTMGERILKVDTAVVALHARISQIIETG